MASRQLFLLLVAARSSAAQSDILGSLFSVAESFITSVFAPATTTSSSSQTTSTSATSSTSSIISTTASPSQTAAVVSSPTAASASTVAAAQASSTSASSSGGGRDGGSNTLAIVLGCTLGALALAAFLALFFFCRRRRRRSKTASKHHALSLSDDEAETWHHEKPRVRSLKEPATQINAMEDMRANTPLTHNQNTSSHHQNPFVPVPPPARRSMHTGAHGDTSYSAHPFRPEDVNAPQTGLTSDTTHKHHANHTLAAGVGGVALGGLAVNARDHHDRKRSTSRGRNTNVPGLDHRFSEDERNALPEAATATRRSGSVSRASAKEPWPFVDAVGRKSSESARPVSRGMHQNQDRFSTPNQYPTESGHGYSGPGMAGAAAAGGLAGAVAAHKSTSRSPHRKGILKQNISDSSDPSSLTTEDYLPPTLSKNSSRPLSLAGPHELATSDGHSAARTGEQNNSQHTSAPLASTIARNEAVKQHRRSGSGGTHGSSTPLPPLVIPHEEVPPIIPSRSPKRTSLDRSHARYSSANEGAAELPSNQGTISPSTNARKPSENDGLLSPVSPISESQTGSWSKAQAAGLNIVEPRAKSSSQESTVVNTSSPEETSQNDTQSSGLVSAIQRIFNSGKSMPEDHEALVGHANADDVQSDREKRLRNVPHRKPAPDRSSHQPISQYGDIAEQQQQRSDIMPGAWENAPTRRSGDSARSLPPRYRSRGNSFSKNYDDGFAPVPLGENHNRSHSRSGYGLGSGDPFDLARTRTDSSMTGISLSNYQEHAANAGRPRSYRKSSGSDFKEPSLADLRREVMAEDRQRARQAWRASHPHSRSNSAGLRYGDDRELFNLVDQTTGHGRYYATDPQDRRGSMGGNVGRAY